MFFYWINGVPLRLKTIGVTISQLLITKDLKLFKNLSNSQI